MTEQMPGSHDLAGATQPKQPIVPDEAREIQVISWDTNVYRGEKDFRPLPEVADAVALVEEEIVVPKDSSAVEPADSSSDAEIETIPTAEQELQLSAVPATTVSPPVVKVNTPGKAPVVGLPTS